MKAPSINFNASEKESRLLEAMDKIRDRFGKGAVGRGGKMGK